MVSQRLSDVEQGHKSPQARKPLEISIYNLYSPVTRKLVLIACPSIALLTLFTDTMYLPALPSVIQNFNTK